MDLNKQHQAAVMPFDNHDTFDQEELKDFEFDGSVPAKYRGTTADQRDMAILGKKQVLRRNFKFITMLGFASTVMASWEVLLPLFSLILVDGGTPDLFWGFVVEACGMLLVYASLAEMASMSPTAGGQYHWVSEFAPPRIQKLLSYLVGWLCAIGWQVYLAGVCFMVGGIIQGLIALNDDTYVPQRWHATLLTIAIISSSIIFNTFLAVKLPLIEGTVLVLHLCGIFAIVIPLWVMAPRAPAHTALLDFTLAPEHLSARVILGAVTISGVWGLPSCARKTYTTFSRRSDWHLGGLGSPQLYEETVERRPFQKRRSFQWTGADADR